MALVLGGLLGRTMHPDLIGRTDRPMGPQMFADWPGEGSTGPFDEGTTFDVAYRVAGGGAVPDYVYGSDWKRAAAADADAQPVEVAAVTPVSYSTPDATADAAPNVSDPQVAEATDDTTAADRAPDNPAREPAYETPAEPPNDPDTGA
jgi:hypothetical protein